MLHAKGERAHHSEQIKVEQLQRQRLFERQCQRTHKRTGWLFHVAQF